MRPTRGFEEIGLHVITRADLRVASRARFDRDAFDLV